MAVTFPELDGEDGFTPALQTLDRIEALKPAIVIPGHGEPFDERGLDKSRELRNAHPEIVMSVDGGVNFDTAPELIEAGVKHLVSGSAIFDGNPAQNIEQFKNLV